MSDSPWSDSPVSETSVSGGPVNTREAPSAQRSHAGEPLPPAKAPIGRGTISFLGLLWSLVLIGAGVVCVQAALVAAGLLDGTPWLVSLVQQLHGLTPSLWMVPVGVVLILLGLWLLLTGLRPRPSTSMTLAASTGVFLKPADVAKIAVAAAEQVDGVQDAKASARRGKVSLHIVGTGSSDIAEDVQRAVADHLSAFDPPVTVTVTGGSS